MSRTMTDTLTPREALENRIAADARNIRFCEQYESTRLMYVIADIAARYMDAKHLGDEELLRAAEENVVDAGCLWRARNPQA